MSESEQTNYGPFEKLLGLSEGFCFDLLYKEDDWSFVIKLNALFEAACTQVIVNKLRFPELEDPISEIDLLNSKFGKVVLLQKLGCLSSSQASAIRMLGELRNNLAHKVSNSGFKFSEYVSTLDPQQMKNFVNGAGLCIAEAINVAGVLMSKKQYVLHSPMKAMLLTANSILAHLQQQMS